MNFKKTYSVSIVLLLLILLVNSKDLPVRMCENVHVLQVEIVSLVKSCQFVSYCCKPEMEVDLTWCKMLIFQLCKIVFDSFNTNNKAKLLNGGYLYLNFASISSFHFYCLNFNYDHCARTSPLSKLTMSTASPRLYVLNGGYLRQNIASISSHHAYCLLTSLRAKWWIIAPKHRLYLCSPCLLPPHVSTC